MLLPSEAADRRADRRSIRTTSAAGTFGRVCFEFFCVFCLVAMPPASALIAEHEMTSRSVTFSSLSWAQAPPVCVRVCLTIVLCVNILYLYSLHFCLVFYFLFFGFSLDFAHLTVPHGACSTMAGAPQDSHRLSVKTWTEEESERADSILSR